MPLDKNFQFQSLGWELHLQVNQKSVRFMDSGWLNIPPTMNVAPKHKMLIFGSLSTSDQLSHLSNESCQKCKKMIWQPLFLHF